MEYFTGNCCQSNRCFSQQQFDLVEQVQDLITQYSVRRTVEARLGSQVLPQTADPKQNNFIRLFWMCIVEVLDNTGANIVSVRLAAYCDLWADQ